MKINRIAITSAVAATLISLVGSDARADFRYATTITLTDAPVQGPATTVSRSFGAGSTLTMVGVDQTGLSEDQGINIANVSLASTTEAPPTDTASIAYAITISITNPLDAPNETGTLTVTGILNFLRSDSAGQLSTNLFTSGASVAFIGGDHFFVDPAATGVYGQPTVNSGPGNISIVITSAPEPASMALMGLGAVGMLAVLRRRMARARA